MNASYQRRTRTQVYQEIAVEWPVSLTEFEKVAAMARNTLVPGTERDDTFTVESTDEELIIRWVSHERVAPESAERRCVEPGCDSFPDATWDRCAEHQAAQEPGDQS